MVERFATRNCGRRQGQHRGGNGDNGQNDAEQHRDNRHGIANDRRHKRVGIAGEVFNLRRQMGFFLQTLGDIERRLLLLFGPRRTRANFLGEVRYMIHWCAHVAPFTDIIRQDVGIFV